MPKLAIGVIVAALVGATAAAGAPGHSSTSGARASIDAKVVRQVRADARTTFWVVLRNQADLRAAKSIAVGRPGILVYQSLTKTANRTQAPMKAWLSQRHVPYKSFWILNAIRVTTGARSELACGTP